MSGIYWLASYPKSGNTWLRVFLENYQRDATEPVSINALPPGNIAYQRATIDDWLGVETADMPCETVDRYRPRFYELMTDSPNFRYVKTHEQFRTNDRGEPVFSRRATAGIVLLVRNPWDVVISMAHFMCLSIAQAIREMANDDFTLSPQARSHYDHLPQLVGSWSTHANSWLDSGLRLHIARYEDLVAKPTAHFGEIVKFLGYSHDQDRLERAIEYSRLDQLRLQESRDGFGGLHTGASVFFRNGKACAWRGVLSQEQIDTIRQQHCEVIERIGYQIESN